MACGRCGRKSPPPLGQTTTTTTLVVPAKMAHSYTLLTTDNRTLTFGSRLEAEAARVRNGGGVIR